MLLYVNYGLTAYLLYAIMRASRSVDATGYLLVSAIIPLPLYIIGNSAQAAVFPVDVCEVFYLCAHGRSLLNHIRARLKHPTGVGVISALSLLATCSGIFNYLFVDPNALKFYVFTIVKFWQYVILAGLLMVNKPDSRALQKIFTILLTGILVYEVLHLLHLSGVVLLSGERYFGARAVEASQWSAAPFADRTGWFLTSYRGVIGGTASINAWLCIMVFESSSGAKRLLAVSLGLLSIFSVFATSSRSDIVGLAASFIVFTVLAPRRWASYAGGALLAIALYAGFLTFAFAPAQRFAQFERVSELWDSDLRADGSYGDRSSDRSSLLRYLPNHPRELLIGIGPGNFHWYQSHRVAINFSGHNAYLHWTGELGIGGFLLVLSWCWVVAAHAERGLGSQIPFRRLAARTCLAILIGRMVTAWGGESLFGAQGMGCYSLYMIGVIYILLSMCADWVPQNQETYRTDVRPHHRNFAQSC